jgi:hypothetical protein
MAYSITQFENNLSNSLVALDQNFTTFGALVPIPCGVSGTNTLTLTQNAVGMVPTATIQGYSTNMLFNGIASGTNTGPVQAQVGSLGLLNVYKDTLTGPQLLTGNEIVINNAFSLRYDPALNVGAGGFHLASNTATVGTPLSPSSVQINSGGTITNVLSGNSPTLTFTAAPGWGSQDQTFTLTGLPPTIPAPGDFVQIVSPSLAAAGINYVGYVNSIGSLSSLLSVATLSVRQINTNSASLASNSGVYRYVATRYVP